MEETYFKISASKVIELAIEEERQKIRKFFLDTLGKATADQLDSYVPTESSIINMLNSIN